MAELPRGRDLMMAALRHYRANPNRENADKALHGLDRMLKVFEELERERDAMASEREAWALETREEIQAEQEAETAWMVWSIYEEHLDCHDGVPFPICPHTCCREALPRLQDAAAAILRKAANPSVLAIRRATAY